MLIAFDPAKDAANVAKYGVSLARASELEMLAVETIRVSITAKPGFGLGA